MGYLKFILILLFTIQSTFAAEYPPVISAVIEREPLSDPKALAASATAAAAVDSSAAATAGDGEVIAVLEYRGGFVNKLAARVEKNAGKVSAYRVAVPKFCQAEVEVAYTVTEGVEDRSTPIDLSNNIFQVKDGPQRLGQILVTLNGPSGMSCDIPILSRTDTGTTPPPNGNLVVNENVAFCNNYRTNVGLAVVYKHEGQWQTEGWINSVPGTCVRPWTAAKISQEFYLFAKSTDGKRWGQNAYFCTHTTNSFVMKGNDACNNKKAGYQMEIFSKAELYPNGQLTKFYFR